MVVTSKDLGTDFMAFNVFMGISETDNGDINMDTLMSKDKQHIFTLLSQLQMLVDTDFEDNDKIQDAFNVLCTVIDDEVPEDYVAS